MDGYVSKPIRQQEMFAAMAEVLTRLGRSPISLAVGEEEQEGERSVPDLPLSATTPLPVEVPAAEAPSNAGADRSQSIYNRAEAIEAIGGDTELFRVIADMFVTDADKYIFNLEAALAAGNGEELAREAHTLKGLFGAFMTPAIDLALEIETRAKEQGAAAVADRVPELIAAVDALRQALHRDNQR
jgi:HPt (histidine-containing phosphotransfer) domain-containing protein